MFTINAKIREKKGKGASRRLRASNKLPAVIYSNKTKSVFIELDHEKVWNMQTKAEFYNEIIVIIVNNDKEKVRVQAVQRHAFKPKLVHIDFIRV